MKRLVLLFTAFGAAVAIVGVVFSGDVLLRENQQVEAQTTSPNIVFVMTDDLDERSMEDLDSLSQLMGGTNGTTFENAYVTDPCAVLLGPPSCGASIPTTTPYSATPRHAEAANKSSGTLAGTDPP